MKPPKTVKIAKITILKFKNSKSTYMIPIDLEAKNAQTLTNFKKLLANIINQSGGIPDEEAMEDIEIPKSEFIDDDIEIPKSELIDDEASKDQINANDLRIATPKDKTSPYNNEWIEIDDDILNDLTFKDYDILAFALEDQPFNIVEAAYEE
ncbi:hypothetical protein CLIB1444_15S01244 [[Candida] jaroonii]|uniref:Uncharacterized protein n=1 Tax=[Candida] jaroonii TaxID=467808 RepID=A0ACA9YEV0_9ASCO|nr:hypothetical protein CLIB1444_15S01244 [[Candida] jaroonii]